MLWNSSDGDNVDVNVDADADEGGDVGLTNRQWCTGR